MRKVFLILLIGFIVLVTACRIMPGHDDVHYYLTQEQKDFLYGVRAGDTVVWESSLGYKDSVIIQPVVYQEFITNYKNGGDTYQQRVYYEYKFLGIKKSNVSKGVSVIANSSYKLLGTSILWDTDKFTTAYAKGVFASRVIGGVLYQDVYWANSMTSPQDTAFWSSKGYLQQVLSTEIVTKIK